MTKSLRNLVWVVRVIDLSQSRRSVKRLKRNGLYPSLSTSRGVKILYTDESSLTLSRFWFRRCSFGVPLSVSFPSLYTLFKFYFVVSVCQF